MNRNNHSKKPNTNDIINAIIGNIKVGKFKIASIERLNPGERK